MATTPSDWKQKIGKAAYLVQAIRLAMQLEATPCRISVDDRVLEADVTIALVGNMGQVIPGAMDLRLPIDPSDGYLDLIAVTAHGAIEGVRGLVDQLTRTDQGGESGATSIRLRGRQISIIPAEPAPLEVDGDYVGEGSLSARILPASLDVLAPGSS
jgi:diacylglycerol kinase family enzyme